MKSSGRTSLFWILFLTSVPDICILSEFECGHDLFVVTVLHILQNQAFSYLRAFMVISFSLKISNIF